MTDINKQKFLAELGRLLTFMYEEDRQQALELYSRLFDDCEDERGLLQLLVSPTRQAVLLARTYDAQDRRLQVHSHSREEDGLEPDEELPGYLLTIDELYQRAAEAGLTGPVSPAAPVLDNQISLFADDLLPLEALVPDTAEEESAPEPLAETPPPLAPMAEDEPSFSPELPEESPAEDADDSAHPEPRDAVDAFLADFTIAGDVLDMEEPVSVQEMPADPTVSESVPDVEDTAAPAPTEDGDTPELPEEELPAPAPVQTGDAGESPEVLPEAAAAPAAVVRKPRVLLLIAYVLLAIPVTAAGLALLMVPAFLVLLLALISVVAASSAFVAAFSGFAVFADTMVVLGTALIVAALGLLLLCLFVWLVGGAMIGLVAQVIRLGKRCCCKEVAVS